MKKSFLAVAIKPQSRQLLFVMTLTFIFGACSKTSTTDMGSTDNSVPASQMKPPPPPPSPANPAIVFNADTTFQYRGQSHTASAIYVIDADGSHRKLIYYDFITSGNSWSRGSTAEPEWSGNGQQICFSGRVLAGSTPPIRPLTSQTSVFTLNFSLVNGVPTASNVTKILDGAADGKSYSNPSWSPTANEIAIKAWGSSNGDPNKIQIVSSTGGTPVTIFTSPTIDFLIGQLCFSPDGSKLAFHIRNNSTGEKWINVIDRFTGAVLNSIVLDPALGWFDLDWSRTSGSSILIFRSFIPNSGGLGSLYQLNFNSSSTPTPLTSNAAYPTWSPDDTKIAFTESTNSQGIIKVLTLATNTITTISLVGSYALNWKR